MTFTASYIIVFLFGVLIGRFTTTVFYRLPRNIMISGFDQKSTRPPFCSKCGHILRFYEYLPIFSWFSTLGKCNYCNVIISKSYIALEILVGLIAIILFYLMNNNLEYFFIYFCFATLILLNIFISSVHNFIPIKITLTIIIIGMIYRTLIDHEIFSWIADFSLASILCLWIIQKNLDSKNLYNYNQSLVHLILPASLWCQNYSILFVATIILISFVISKIIKDILFYPICVISVFLISLIGFMNFITYSTI